MRSSDWSSDVCSSDLIRSDGSPLEGSLEMCDYCDCRSVDLIKRLGEEHASITAQGSIIRRLALFGDIAEARLRMVDLIAELNDHTEVEETALFPAMRESTMELGRPSGEERGGEDG